MKLGVLASHEGTTLQAVIEACAMGTIDGAVGVVISNNSTSGALQRAKAARLPTKHLSARTHPDADALDRAIRDALREYGCDWVLLAGYMKRLGPATLAAYRCRIVNTHPALLPKFGGQGLYGRRVHEAVLAAGERVSGVGRRLRQRPGNRPENSTRAPKRHGCKPGATCQGDRTPIARRLARQAR